MRTPIDNYLREQQQLTAVERFAQRHAAETVPLQQRYYSALLPATPPGAGQQYAFDVDLDACSGCKACVTACHSLNGLDEGEAWRDVGLLTGGSNAAPVLQHVTAACHHCLEPACLQACPVDAYEKDPVTGIVRHLDDQCFGCQYCTLACPYDVPKYHGGKGIVRKCDMCSGRLAAGEAPACVQACPHEAIRITVVDKEAVVANCETNLFLPGAPEPHRTLPTTNYRTRRVLPRNVLPADYFAVHPEQAHWSLVVMLVLTQLSVGTFVVDYLLSVTAGLALSHASRGVSASGALVLGLAALAASTCHLGRPQYAFRALIGLRHSWLSREIVAFGLFASLATTYAVSLWLTPEGTPWAAFVRRDLGGLVAASGLLAVACSVMIYQFTGREFWSGSRTGFGFATTTLVLGAATSLAANVGTALFVPEALEQAGGFATGGQAHSFARALCSTVLAVSGVRLLVDASLFRHLRSRQYTAFRRSAMLLRGPLAGMTNVRFACGSVGGVLIPAWLLDRMPRDGAALSTATLVWPVVLMLLTLIVAELAARYLFFAAVAAPRMPGALRT